MNYKYIWNKQGLSENIDFYLVNIKTSKAYRAMYQENQKASYQYLYIEENNARQQTLLPDEEGFLMNEKFILKSHLENGEFVKVRIRTTPFDNKKSF